MNMKSYTSADLDIYKWMNSFKYTMKGIIGTYKLPQTSTVSMFLTNPTTCIIGTLQHLRWLNVLKI